MHRLPSQYRLIASGISASVDLYEGCNVLGRDAQADICLSVSSVSRRHAQIIVQAEQVLLCDLNSTNGTWVNGQRIDQLVLTPGMTFSLGSQVVFTLAGEPVRRVSHRPAPPTRPGAASSSYTPRPEQAQHNATARPKVAQGAGSGMAVVFVLIACIVGGAIYLGSDSIRLPNATITASTRSGGGGASAAERAAAERERRLNTARQEAMQIASDAEFQRRLAQWRQSAQNAETHVRSVAAASSSINNATQQIQANALGAAAFRSAGLDGQVRQIAAMDRQMQSLLLDLGKFNSASAQLEQGLNRYARSGNDSDLRALNKAASDALSGSDPVLRQVSNYRSTAVAVDQSLQVIERVGGRFVPSIGTSASQLRAPMSRSINELEALERGIRGDRDRIRALERSSAVFN